MLKAWVAVAPGEPEPVLLEHLHPDLAEHPTALGRFRRRAMLAGRLQHPNVLKTLGHEEADGQLVVLSELCFGVGLHRVIERAQGGVPVPIFASVARRLLRALVHAHEAKDASGKPLGLIHRHLAAPSVQMGFAGEVKLGDFTLALADVGSFRTAAGMAVGTVGAMSPEQVRGQSLDPRSDLYAVSTLLYELLTGVPLVPAGPRIEMLRAVAEAPAPPIDRPDLPPEVAEAVARGLEKAPDHRFSSARSYLGALEAALGPPDGNERDTLSAFVRSLLPDEEQSALDELGKLRAAMATLPSARAPSARSRPPTAPRLDDEPEAPEPSVMTMPGVAAAPDPARLPVVSYALAAPPPAPEPPAPRTGVAVKVAALAAALAVAGGLVALSFRPDAPMVGAAPRARTESVRAAPRAEPARVSVEGRQEAPRARADDRPQRPPVALPSRSRPPDEGRLPPVPPPAPSPSPPMAPSPTEPSSAPPPSLPPQAVELRAELTRLRVEPDPRRFYAAHARLTALAADLEPAAHRRARALLDAAERAQDLDNLVGAFDVVFR